MGPITLWYTVYLTKLRTQKISLLQKQANNKNYQFKEKQSKINHQDIEH